MPGVYGEQLAAFPELLIRYNVFTMRPLVGGGFSERTPFKAVLGYLTRDFGGKAEQSDANFVEGKQAKFFVFDQLPSSLIAQGMYVEDSEELFKIEQSHGFVREAGLTIHRLQIVTGATDKQVPNNQVEENIINAY